MRAAGSSMTFGACDMATLAPKETEKMKKQAVQIRARGGFGRRSIHISLSISKSGESLLVGHFPVSSLAVGHHMPVQAPGPEAESFKFGADQLREWRAVAFDGQKRERFDL